MGFHHDAFKGLPSQTKNRDNIKSASAEASTNICRANHAAIRDAFSKGEGIRVKTVSGVACRYLESGTNFKTMLLLAEETGEVLKNEPIVHEGREYKDGQCLVWELERLEMIKKEKEWLAGLRKPKKLESVEADEADEADQESPFAFLKGLIKNG